MLLITPKFKTDMAKHNFVYQGSSIWNSLIKKLMNKCEPNSDGIMVPGSAYCSDLSTPVSIIKKKLKDVLLKVQELDTPAKQGWKKSDEWQSENFYTIC